MKILPPELHARMKNGRKLDRVWLNPNYDTASGFVLGRIERCASCAEGRFASTVEHFPVALGRLVVPGSAQVLNLAITGFDAQETFDGGHASASLVVEGQVLGPGGEVLFAFVTREHVDNRESAASDCEAAMDKIAWSLAMELDPALGKRYLAQARPDAKAGSLIQLPGARPGAPEPKAVAAPLPVPDPPSMEKRDRLLQLEFLLKDGLVTREEYERIRGRILDSL